ncbi:hypothetical protein ARMGADRAFT_738479 [Armillaria gallica]|uniref:Uncharacterized protein n=1 Tax=Armillaria gallica TaxID=47427 RepID=A0A2H3CV48_ARMGA|nr:hypothetical protein ARMGADRAFT_738479 [Armillaria gallica]
MHWVSLSTSLWTANTHPAASEWIHQGNLSSILMSRRGSVVAEYLFCTLPVVQADIRHDGFAVGASKLISCLCGENEHIFAVGFSRPQSLRLFCLAIVKPFKTWMTGGHTHRRFNAGRRLFELVIKFL